MSVLQPESLELLHASSEVTPRLALRAVLRKEPTVNRRPLGLRPAVGGGPPAGSRGLWPCLPAAGPQHSGSLSLSSIHVCRLGAVLQIGEVVHGTVSTVPRLQAEQHSWLTSSFMADVIARRFGVAGNRDSEGGREEAEAQRRDGRCPTAAPPCL